VSTDSLLFLVLLLGVSVPGFTQDQARLDTALSAIQKNYDRFKEPHDLAVSFELKYEQISGPRNFIFDSAWVQTYRKGAKSRLHIHGSCLDGSELDRSYAWDGRISTGLEAWTKGAGDYFVQDRPHNNMYYYNYFIDAMGYPDASGAASDASGDRGRSLSSWLPRSLLDSRAAVRTRPDLAIGELADCLVLEQPGREISWFDPRQDYVLRCRDILFGEGKGVKRRVRLGEFQPLGGTLLPSLCIWEEFAAQQDMSTPQLLSRRVIRVKTFSTKPLPDEWFRLSAPEGVGVHDSRRRVFFTHYQSGVNPLIESAERARSQVVPEADLSLVSYSAIAGMASLSLVLLCFGRRMKRGAA
jgi:hypothetical protein